MLELLLDLLYPKRCLSCGSFGSYLCSQCTLMMQFIKVEICPVCEKPAIDGETHPRCKTKYSMDGLLSFWEYKGLVRKIIHKLKYAPWTFAAIEDIISVILGRSEATFMQAERGEATTPESKNRHTISNHQIMNPAFLQFISTKPILVPIPLHKSRLKWRGYNHSAIIAKELGKHWNLKVAENVLIRKIDTKPQVGLKYDERKKNIQNAFDINKDSKFIVQDSRYIIVDDVWTTGSTLKACTTVLKKNGAQKVRGLTLAR